MKWLFSSVFGIVGLIFVLIGCPFLLAGGGFYYFVQTRTNTWIEATGTVTGLQQSQSTDSDGFSSTTYCPYVEFTTDDGEAIETSVNDCSSPPAFETGDPVTLKYNPENPREVQIKGGTLETLSNVFGVVFGGLGGLLLCGGLVLGLIGIVVVMRRST